MEKPTIDREIRAQIYCAFEVLGADAYLLGVVGSWGDTIGDEEVLKLLKQWNERNLGRQLP